MVEPGLDEFPAEKVALEVEARLRAAFDEGKLPCGPDCKTISPKPVEYRNLASGVDAAVFGATGDAASAWSEWRRSLGNVRAARFYSLPGDRIRYDIRSSNRGRLEHRTGWWKQSWKDGSVASFEPVSETLTYSSKPLFQDITGDAFAGEPSFREQLARGVPYWRARLDPALGIDVYGENGIAAADIDGDGIDEIYVC